MPDEKFLKYRAKILAVNTGDQPDRLTQNITVPTFRGYQAGDVIPAGTLLRDIINKEFNSTPPTPKVTIVVVGTGTTDPTAGAHDVTYGGDFTFNSTTPGTGYKLKDIVVDGETKTSPFTIRNITADKTITVTFEELPPTTTFTITGTAGEHGSISPTDAGSYEEGTAVEAKTFTATPETNYSVNKWSVNGVEQSETGNTFTLPAISAIDKDYVVNVTFKDNTYKVNVTDSTPSSLSNYGTIFPAVGEHVYTAGQELTISATPNTGFKVKTFTVNGSAVTGSTYTLRNSEIEAGAINNVIVEFEEQPADVYHVKVEDNTDQTLTNYGTIVPAAQTTSYDYEVGTDSSVVATPNAGFKIKSFKVDGVEQTISDPTQAFTHQITGIAKDVTVTVSVEFEAMPAGFIAKYWVPEDEDEDWLVPTLSNMTLIDKTDKTAAELEEIENNGDTFAFVASSGAQEPVYVFPATMGDIVSIKQSGQEIMSGWAKTTLTIDGVACKVYYLKGCTTRGTFALSWK